jgi:hypothetical protein
MRMTLTIQVASASLSAKEIAEVIGYPGNLVVKGYHRIPPRNLPKFNMWNGGLVLRDVQDTDKAARACLDQYPDLAERVRILKGLSPDIECTLYFGLRPFSPDFILFFERETLRRLAEIECELSIEYFDEEGTEQDEHRVTTKRSSH